MGNLLWLIIIVLLIAWLLGGFVFPVGGNLIHILIVIAAWETVTLPTAHVGRR